MKIIVLEEGKEPVTLETKDVVIMHGSSEIFTNLDEDRLISKMCKSLFSIITQSLLS